MKEGKATHVLKTWSEYFQKIQSGEKTFEIRKNDRGFKVGDILLLQEWIPSGYNSVSPNELVGEFTGNELIVEITYILKIKPEQQSLFGINSDYCIMSINLTTQQEYIQQLEDALNKIIEAPEPYYEREMNSWIETARNIAKQALKQ